MLPIKLEPFDNESGFGYCLRSITKNGGRLSDIRKILNISDNEFLKNSHSTVLSKLFDVNESFFRYSLPQWQRISEKSKRECYGNNLGKKSFLKLSRAQICPICINKKPYIVNHWDFTFSCCCLEHGIVLLDKCTKCGKQIDWNRPDISWGSCGHFLGDCNKLEKANQLSIEYQKIFVKFFHRESVHACIESLNLPSLLSLLSVDAWTSLILSLGGLVEPWGSILAKDHMRIKSTHEVILVVERAMDRLIKFSNGEDISPWVVESGLFFVINNSPIKNDRLIIMRILENIFTMKNFNNLKIKNKDLFQLELF